MSHEKPKVRVPLIIGIAATSALTVAAVITGLLAVSDHTTYADASLPIAQREDARSSGRALAITTDCLIVGAIAAGAYTTYWYVKHRHQGGEAEGPPASEKPEAALAPYVTADGAGIAVLGRF